MIRSTFPQHSPHSTALAIALMGALAEGASAAETPAAADAYLSAAAPATSATAVGGYGEAHYKSLDSGKQMDLKRFVLFLGHSFSEQIRFFSELEVEHAMAGDGEPGEVAMEQAYLEFDLPYAQQARAGLLLIPAGILNETHEPTTFYGVERNPVERNIIPTTWREGGVALAGRRGAWGYDAAVTSGMNMAATGAPAYQIRGGRQGGAQAVAEDLAYTARLRWTGRPGIEVAGSLQYQSDVTQGAQGVEGLLATAHVALSRGAFGLRLLGARWWLDGAGPETLGRDSQWGWYVEPSYKIRPQLGAYVRYSEWDLEAGDAGTSVKKQGEAGVNYWPHDNVVLKADYQRQGGTADDDGYYLGIGYHF